MKAFVGMLQIYCIKIQYSHEHLTSQVAALTATPAQLTTRVISRNQHMLTHAIGTLITYQTEETSPC